MSYERLQQSNSSSYNLGHLERQSLSDVEWESDSDSDPDHRKVSSEGFELKDLGGTRRQSLNRLRSQDVAGIDDIEREEAELAVIRRGSASTMQSFMLYTPDEEEEVIRKLDRKLVLFVAFLYMLSFLDRSNIGNAKVAGLSDDLHLDSSRFEWLLRAFYITYIAFEWMTLLWKIFRPHIYLAICVASWGIIASLQSLAFSFWSMLILRACLGIGEAAFVGIPFYLSFFYKRNELALRTGLFISAAPLATSFAGTLAWLITKFGDSLPVASWRLLFLLEGFPSIVVAVFVYFHIPDDPGSARYLSPRERKVAKLRLGKEDEPPINTHQSGLKWTEISQTLKDPKSYFTAAMFFGCNVAFSSLPVFLPTLIQEMGFSALASQALSAPPYLVAFLMVLVTAWLSDRLRSRSTFVIFHALLAALGYAMMAVAGSVHARPMVRYAGVYPAAAGFFSAITIIITWTINNQENDSGKGTGLAMLNYIGQLGPLLGVHLYPDRDQPYYTKGMAICAVSMGMVAGLAYALRRILWSKNTRVQEYEKVNVEDDEAPGTVAEQGARPFIFMI